VGEIDGETGPGLTRYCRSCGTRLSEPVGRFCQGCGAEIGSADYTKPVEQPARRPANAPPAPETDADGAPSDAGGPPGKPPAAAGRSKGKQPQPWLIAVVALAAVAVVAALFLAGGGSGSTSPDEHSGITSLPSPNDIPPQTVALVSHVPRGLGTISVAELEKAIASSAALSGDGPAPKPASAKYEKAAEAALSELLDSARIQGEGAELGFAVTRADIAAELAKIKRQSFKSEREYQEFLKTSHYTDADVNKRVKVQILSTRIQRKIAGEAAAPTNAEIAHYYAANKDVQFTEPAQGSKPAHVRPLSAVRGQIATQLKQKAEEKAFANYIKRFDAKWRARIVCVPRYAVEDCSNGPVPKPTSQSQGSNAEIPAGP
jgi:hypothetical protein